MSFSKPLLMFMRAAAAVQIVLGIGFWTGHWAGLVQAHMGIGSLYVLALWIIAGIAIANRRLTGLAAFSIVWGIVIAALGMTQSTMMVGDLHWIVRVIHLIVALSAMPLAERLTVAAGAGAH